MANKLTDEDLIKITDQYIAASTRYIETEIAESRKKAKKYYDGAPFGNEKPGRSKVVSPDVRNAIEWTLPTLLRIFFSSDHVIEYAPVGEGDSKGAEFFTLLFDYIVTKKNAGFMIYYMWFKDALLKRAGFTTAYWATEDVVDKVQYSLTKPEYDLAVADEAFDIESVESVTQEIPVEVAPGQQVMQTETIYEVSGSYSTKKSDIIIKNIPPEEMFFLRSTRSNKESRFWMHRSEQTLTDLREQGYEVDDDIKGDILTIEGQSKEEVALRHRNDQVGEEIDQDDEMADLDPSMKLVHFYNMDVKADIDGTGQAKWWKICRVGDEIIDKTTIPYPMYATLTPLPTPHILVGDGFFELLGKFQELTTSMQRIILDYTYYSTTPRAEVAMSKWDSEFTLSDWMNNPPNGMVRVRESGAVTPIYPAPLNNQIMGLMEYWEAQKESSAGVGRSNQGQDASLGKAAPTSLLPVLSSAASRIELIARVFAETGIRQLAEIIKDLITGYPKEAEQMMARISDPRLQGVDVRDLSGDFDYVITVGTGNADKTQILESILAMFGLWEKVIQMGAGPMAEKQLVTWENMYQGLREFVKSAGLKNIGMFTNDPQIPPKDPPPPPPESPQDKAAVMQAEFLQVEGQVKQEEVQISKFKAQVDAEIRKAELALRKTLETEKLRIMAEKNEVDAMSKGVSDGAK